MLLAIHTLCCPPDPKEKILREDCLLLGKLKEEGTLAKELTILGWTINTHLLMLVLPLKKFKYWQKDLKTIIQSKKISYKRLETIVGHLNHSASACPLMQYYLNCIRNTIILWKKTSTSKKCERYLTKSVIEALKLW
jgi:hypothetical protein